MSDSDCPICCKKVKKSIKSRIFCTVCKTWSHTQCNLISRQDVDKVCCNWHCLKCNSDLFPFFEKIINPVVPTAQLRCDLNKVFDSDHQQNCKYYDPEEFIDLCKSFHSNFSFLHLNISSLSLHFDSFQTLLYNLQHGFSFIGLTETRFLQNNPLFENFSLSGYSYEHTPTESTCGGALLYISQSVSYKVRNDLSLLFYKSKQLESIFIEICLKRKNVIVACIYRHPCMEISEFNSLFLRPLLDILSRENKEIVLLGDFNINLLRSDLNSLESEFLDLMGSHHYLPNIVLPTRVTSKTSSLIDNIFTSTHLITNYKSVSGNLTIAISDHMAQFLMLEEGDVKSGKNENCLYLRDWSRFKKDDFILDYFSYDWDRILNYIGENVNEIFDLFFQNLNELIDKHIPLKKLNKKQQRRKGKPWITKGILSSIRKRNQFFKKFLKCTDAKLKEYLYRQYKNYRNSIVTLMRVSKQNYYSEYFRNYKNNIKKSWKGINEIINSSNSHHNDPISLNVNSVLTSDKLVIANYFNDYFSTISSKVRDKIQFTNKNFSDYLPHPNTNSMFLTPTTPDEVLNCINSLKSNKSSGPNSIPFKILHLLKAELSIILSNIINRSFSLGTFPSLLKVAKVIPIFKKGSTLDVQNYRPISLLSNIDKIFQKLMHKRLINFFESKKLLYPLQFGFRTNHSTEISLLHIIERIQKSLDNGQVACGIFLDLQKAFDTVDHSILLAKLRYYGIRGKVYDWFKSFLSDRSQYVSIGNVKSDVSFVIHGVPQGSVLGPLLFLIYINDMNNAINFSSIFHFADDTNMLNCSRNLKQLSKQVNIDLKQILHWLNANKISLNASKTEFVLFKHQRRHINFDLRIKINGQRLYPSSFIKYLGVYVDENLNWSKHIENLSVKLRRANGALSKLRYLIPKSLLISIYHSIFFSHISYACMVWGQRETSITKRVFLLQKQAIRIISNSDWRAHSTPLFFNFNFMKFFDFVKYRNILFIHQFLNNELPQCLHNTFSFAHLNSNINTRGRTAGLLVQHRFNTVTFGQNSIQNQSISAWNLMQLNLQIDDLSKLPLHKVKRLSKSYFISSYID